MSATHMGTRWSCISSASFHWRMWDDQYVIYNDLSGHTHVLQPIAAFLLQEIALHSRTDEELLQEMACSLHLSPDAQLRDQVRKTLASLDELGLIESTPS